MVHFRPEERRDTMGIMPQRVFGREKMLAPTGGGRNLGVARTALIQKQRRLMGDSLWGLF